MLTAESFTRTHDGASSSASKLPGVGDLVAGRYRLTRVIGAGGMGTVYEAESSTTGRRCAVKFLGGGSGGHPRSAARFEREAQTLARLEHEHVISVFDFGWFEDQTPFFVMEYLRGQTLRQLLEQSGPLEPQRALELLIQACRGMAHAHAHGVVHRDLKPENLMLTQHADGRPWLKILDFGVARQLEAAAIQLTPTGAELGTPHYMSPEQARGETTVDARADVYALGAISYEALSGRRLHAGSSYNEILFQVITQPHVPLSAAAPGCPLSLNGAIELCLEREAAKRPCDAGELLKLLEQVQRSAAPESTRSGSASAALPRAALGRDRWSRWLWPLATVSLAAVVATGWRGAGINASSAACVGTSPLVSISGPAPTPSASVEAGPALPAAEPSVAEAPPPMLRRAAPPPTTNGAAPQRLGARPSRPAARPGQPKSADEPLRAAPSPTPSGPDLPFATTNPYERP